jgi:hypothetical protein
MTGDAWPELPYDEWRDTRDTLHMYTQVVGKLRLALSPFEPEWANVPLYVTARGLSTRRWTSSITSWSCGVAMAASNVSHLVAPSPISITG